MTRPSYDDPFAVTRVNGPADVIPEWDVASVGAAATKAILADVESVRKHTGPTPDPARVIHLLQGPPGYGKTHLFARLKHQLGKRVEFVFVSAPKQVTRLAYHAAWEVVETLFRSSGDFAPIRTHLASLVAPSFLSYFEQLTAGLQAKTTHIREALAHDPLAALEVFAPITELTSYTGLAEALRVRLPNVNPAVSKALMLSLCPAADDARWWLRGEADQVPEARLSALGLPHASPAPTDVITGVAELLRLVGVPLVIVFDQLDALLLNAEYGFRELTGELMGWLQKVPNLVLAIGVFPGTLKALADSGADGVAAFDDRTRAIRLAPLTPDEAVGLVRARMSTWSEANPSCLPEWPFDVESVRAFVGRQPTPPRGFIQTCADRFNDWLATKRAGTIHLGGAAPPASKPELLAREWAALLETVSKANKSPLEYKEEELWGGVEEALEIAKLGKYVPAGVALAEIGPSGMQSRKGDPRVDASLRVSAGGRHRTIIVAVSKKDGGGAFSGWVTRLEGVLDEAVAGALVIRPHSQLTIGQTAASYLKYKGWVAAGRVRSVALDENINLLHQLECLRQLTELCEAKGLILNSEVIGLGECRDLIVQTGLLANLKLFEFVFHNWPGFNPDSAPDSGPVPPPVPPVVPPQERSVPLARPVSVVPPPPTGPVPVAVAQPMPASPPPPVAPPALVVPPSPNAGPPDWVETMLKKATDYLKKRGQQVRSVGTDVGPTFVRFKVEPQGDADFTKIKKQEKNLKVHLLLEHEPLIQAQAGYVSIDVQRPQRITVELPPLLAACPPKLAGEPAFPVGVGVAGNAEWLNLSEPEGCHLLVAGTTGSGKSEFLKAVLAALAARLEPSQVRFRLIDPKRVTFNVPDNCPYLGGPVVYDGEEALPVLEECSDEMERRYKLLQQRRVDHVRHLTGVDAVPRWVVVMDEFADLMTDKGTKKLLEPLLKRLGAKARAAGIHLVLGTQRPDASVVTPVLRSNLPGKIGLQVGSERESKLFLDGPDAAYLFGKGDLVWKRGGGLVRLQSPFVPKDEFNRLLRVG